MPAPFSRDLRERIVRAVEGGSSIRQAASRFDVSPSAAVKLLRRVRESGSPAPARSGGDRRSMLDGHEAVVRSLLGAKPDGPLVEIRAPVAPRGAVGRAASTVHRRRRRARLAHKRSR